MTGQRRLDESEYSIPFFREKGFYRKKCSVCGQYFWTLDANATTCQDSPCVEYYFDKIPSRKAMSISQARSVFLKFYEKRGHKILKPRPVVARWREDLYLTIASIVVFQPHVTNGIVPPPANPLVISQPCIRLEDVDNVGVTIGRHLTIFEMGGHHAFNSSEEQVYWKDETVRMAFEFFTQEVGIPPEKLAFKESWWEGGGNAGPSFEVAAGGLELATLVFMQYKIKPDGSLEPIPLKIVDTGYGIERIAWFTQKTPTAFHTIYGGLLDRLRTMLKTREPDSRLLKAAFRRAGRLDPEDPQSLDEYYRGVAEEAGQPLNLVRETLEREARLYSVLDHTKTIAFMLADGIVPSNQGEGYLARLLIRRTLKNLQLLDAGVSLREIVELQIDYWRHDFPRLEEMRNYILEVVEVEEEKYRHLLREGIQKAIRLLRKNPHLETLIKIYQELGLPPEIVVEEARKRGVGAPPVPPNFYSMIAREGQAPRPSGEEEAPEWLKGLPETRRLFHENPYLRENEARVLAVNGKSIVVDQTVAYPTGGGQVNDTGIIEWGEGSAQIIDVRMHSGVIEHVLDREPQGLRVGQIVRIRIDWERRYRIMRHHTATHIMLGALRRIFGPHVWQAGAEKTPEKGRLDFTHYKPLSSDEIKRIEGLANSIVLENLPVNVRMMDKNEAEEKYGFTLYQGGVPLQRRIRIVEIPGHDIEACFGTHVKRTGEVGGIKITNIEKLQDGVYRVEYTAGTQIATYAGELEGLLHEAARTFGGGFKDVPRRAKSLARELEEKDSLLSRYRRFVEETLLGELLRNAREIKGLKLTVYHDGIGDAKLSTELLVRAVKEDPRLVVARIQTGTPSLVELSLGEHAARMLPATVIVKELTDKLGGKGGGKPTHAFWRANAPLEREEVEKLLREIIKEKL